MSNEAIVDVRFDLAGQRSNRALVFLHGIGGGSKSWRPQLEHFSQSHFCVAWNTPGYGGREITRPLTFANAAEALAQDLNDLDVDQAVVIGQSMGGMLAQTFARTNPNIVAGLFLTATTGAFGKPDGDFQKQFVQSRTRPLDDGVSMEELAKHVVPRLFAEDASAASVAHAVEYATDCMASVPAQTYRDALACIVQFDIRNELSNIACPVFLLAGEKDPNVPVKAMQNMAGKFPDAHFEIAKNAGHLINLERPNAFNTHLQFFLDSLNSEK